MPHAIGIERESNCACLGLLQAGAELDSYWRLIDTRCCPCALRASRCGQDRRRLSLCMFETTARIQGRAASVGHLTRQAAAEGAPRRAASANAAR